MRYHYKSAAESQAANEIHLPDDLRGHIDVHIIEVSPPKRVTRLYDH